MHAASGANAAVRLRLVQPAERAPKLRPPVPGPNKMTMRPQRARALSLPAVPARHLPR
jgi:hypothetical protein